MTNGCPHSGHLMIISPASFVDSPRIFAKGRRIEGPCGASSSSNRARETDSTAIAFTILYPSEVVPWIACLLSEQIKLGTEVTYIGDDLTGVTSQLLHGPFLANSSAPLACWMRMSNCFFSTQRAREKSES